MQFKALAKFIFFILLTISLANIQSYLVNHQLVLANFRVSLADFPRDLSQSEKIDLQQGKVILRGEKGNYLGRVIATGDLDTAWQVLIDYDNFDKFLPNIKSSKIISESGDRLVFEQVNIVDLWLFQQEFKVTIEAKKQNRDRIDFKIIEGDLKKLIGRWDIQAQSDNKILVSNRVEVEPAGNVEKPFFYGVYESTLEETLKAIALEINKRSQI